ncbi:MAG TPA: DUF1801 domain-containing protein [bacterium]|nr:DUF1801 domain-containing protein [bacterium]HQG45035.1 DUF1801 domain-containing protein [bacterium]HQI48224.1 DUF1801 domain-containing protein [bacterium]HQJ65112.1 DUF1801 domain-containing protein [bacterium]
MAKNDLKTRVNDASVVAFLESITDEQKRNDSFEILEMMKKITREEPKMWGASIIGFGSYHYKGKGGREGDWMVTGFSPRKQNLVLYLMGGFDANTELLEMLGKFTTGMGCLYIKKLADVDRKILEALLQASYKRMKQQYK